MGNNDNVRENLNCVVFITWENKEFAFISILFIDKSSISYELIYETQKLTPIIRIIWSQEWIVNFFYRAEFLHKSTNISISWNNADIIVFYYLIISFAGL